MSKARMFQILPYSSCFFRLFRYSRRFVTSGVPGIRGEYILHLDAARNVALLIINTSPEAPQ